MRAILVATTVLSLAAACGSPPVNPFLGLVTVSGPPPYDAGCNGGLQPGTNAPGLDVEPMVAVDPSDANHLIGVWQQDRWSNGGSNGLPAAVSFNGGKSWVFSSAPLSRCAGGKPPDAGDYERASDPWVTFAADGTVYQSSLSFNSSKGRAASGILVSRSVDKGLTWDSPVALIQDVGTDNFNDKDAITADPVRRSAYAVWDRTTGGNNPNPKLATGPAWFARMTQGSWEPARSIFDPGADAQTLGNQIGVLPDGTLVDLTMILTQASSNCPPATVAMMRSTDQGTTWSAPVNIAARSTVGVFNPKNGMPIREGDQLAAMAIDRSSGKIYAVWQDSRFGDGSRNGIALSTSSDGGLTWSAPVQINQAPSAPAFLPAVAVTPGGAVGVSYYDLRNDDADDPSVFLATAWLATSHDGGGSWQESALTGPFDLTQSLIGGAYFLGDYEGIVASGETFVPFFAVAHAPGTSSNPTDIVVRPVGG